MESALNSGDTAWMLTAAAMVMLMIPGLAFFYGGMVRSKSVLNMLMMVMGATFIVGVPWVIFGYSMTFGPDIGGVIGDPTEFLGLESLMADDSEATLPIMAFVAFQGMFACLTVGLIAGAAPDRTKYNGGWSSVPSGLFSCTSPLHTGCGRAVDGSLKWESSTLPVGPQFT